MTKKEFETKEKVLDDQIDDLQNQKSNLINMYISSLPIKKGELVTVVRNSYAVVKTEIIKCFIGDITYSRYGKIEIKFKKIKKDGAMSEQSIGIYSFDYIIKEDGTKINPLEL